MTKDDIIYALDAIQTPLSLYDPVYTDSGDTLYVMDQISDKKNKEENSTAPQKANVEVEICRGNKPCD